MHCVRPVISEQCVLMFSAASDSCRGRQRLLLCMLFARRVVSYLDNVVHAFRSLRWRTLRRAFRRSLSARTEIYVAVKDRWNVIGVVVFGTLSSHLTCVGHSLPSHDTGRSTLYSSPKERIFAIAGNPQVP